ncbi:hypothetical protein B0H34DRAFT_382450 [Crassisporium funariophilum]|nr:hypothetical protein B0H34DRAFT_382450 [Crassisporium funariophilum]
MARLLKPTIRQPKTFIIIAVLAILNILILSEYVLPRRRALALDDEDTYEHLRVEKPSASPRVLIVSSMFMLPKSKHSKEYYHDWLKRFLEPVTTDIYFYTSPDFASTVRSARGEGLPLTVDTSYNTPFDVPPLRGLKTKYESMHKIDRENSYHSPDLYAVWNAKPFFVDNAVRIMADRGYKYDYVFWNDGGSFREINVYKHWPSPQRLEQIWQEGSELTGVAKKDLLFYPVMNQPPRGYADWTEDMGPIDIDLSEGSFFGGSPSTVAWWARTFYAYHDHYLSKGMFVGKDQTLFNALFFLFSERIVTVWVYDPEAPAHDGMVHAITRGYLGSCGPEWYYYQFWLSDRKTRDEMRQIWLENDREPENARWWKVKVPCRLTGVLALRDILRRTYGNSWEPPVPTIDTPPRSWQQ